MSDDKKKDETPVGPVVPVELNTWGNGWTWVNKLPESSVAYTSNVIPPTFVPGNNTVH